MMKTIRGSRMIILSGLAAMFVVSGQASAETYRLGIDGLACPLCTFGIEKQLKKVKGVTAVKTDLASSTVLVTTPDGRPVERAALERAVQKASFSIRSFEVVKHGKTDQAS